MIIKINQAMKRKCEINKANVAEKLKQAVPNWL